MVQTRLTSALNDLRLSHGTNAETLESLAKERADLDRQEAELRAEVDRVSAYNGWFMDFQNWVEDVAAFLEEKVRLQTVVKRSPSFNHA